MILSHEPMAWVWLAIILLTLAGVAMGRFPRFAMNRATICLVGATLLVQTRAMTLEQAYQAVDMDTLVLLLAMMVINANLRLAGFFKLVAHGVMARKLPPRSLLALLMLAAGVLSAIFLNDTIVLAFTPLVLEVILAANLAFPPFLIGLAVAANIGSVATLIGNPQNMLIGMASDIPFTRFLWVLGPVALGGLVLAWLILVVLFRRELGQPVVHTLPDHPVHPNLHLLKKSLLATTWMVIALFAGMAVSLAALSAASLLLITRRTHPERVFQEIDWGLLVFFASLFVVSHAVAVTGWSDRLLTLFPAIRELGIPSLTAIGVVMSNLISNVPAVLLLQPMVHALPWQETAWLTLAMATTLAGNLTLLGSVANLIVAESARRQGVILGFGTYLRAGLPITLATLAWGIGWLQWTL